MTFRAALKTVYLSKFLSFSGRASRREFWLAFGFYFVVLIGWAGLVAWFGASVGDGSDPSVPLMVAAALSSILTLFMTVPIFTLFFRRLHDLNRSGLWFPFACTSCALPYVGVLPLVILLVFMTLRGTEGANKFGPDPVRGILDPRVFA